MIECKKLKTYTDDWITVAVNKKNEDVIIATKKKLLEYCLKCENQDDCEDASRISRKLTQ